MRCLIVFIVLTCSLSAHAQQPAQPALTPEQAAKAVQAAEAALKLAQSALAASINAPAPTYPPAPSAPSAVPAAPPDYPDEWAGIYGGYSSKIAGGFSYAKLISKSGPVYSFTTTDIVSLKRNPFVVQTSPRTGLATVLRQFGPVTVLALADAGMAVAPKPTALGTNVGFATSGGGLAIWRIKSFSVGFGARVLKSALGTMGARTIVEVVIGYSPK